MCLTHIKKLEVPEEYSREDKNTNGILDPIDLNNLKGKEMSKTSPFLINI
ncbi:hypothetical protein [Clostridium gasigenes]|nr:hypothetical protein [Clostridium gasigenes]MBU3105054.1 hypothetical protein [Clostridium gasigenes]